MWIASTHHQHRFPTAFLPFPPAELVWVRPLLVSIPGGGVCVVCYQVMYCVCKIWFGKLEIMRT